MAINENDYKYVTGYIKCANVSTKYQLWGGGTANAAWEVNFESIKVSGAGRIAESVDSDGDNWYINIDSSGHPVFHYSRSSTAYNNTKTFSNLTVSWNTWFSLRIYISTNAASPTFTCTVNGTSQSIQCSGRFYVNYTHDLQVGGPTSTLRGTTTVKGYLYNVTTLYTATFNIDSLSVGATSMTTDGYTFTISSAVQQYILKYTVSYNANGGTSTPSSTTFNYNASITLASAISRTSTANGTLTHTFHGNGGTPTSTTKTTAITKNYSFNGWHEGTASGTVHAAGSTWTPGKTVTLYAGWNESNSYAGLTLPSNPTWATSTNTTTRTVTLNANGGSVSPTSVKTESKVTTTHTFTGWFTASSGGSQVNTSTKPTAGTNYYAHWNTATTTAGFGSVTLPTPTRTTSTSTKSITITYNGNGGTISPTSTTRTVTTNTSYSFNKWWTGTSSYAAGSYTPTGNVTLTACWTPSTVTTTTTLGTIPTSGSKTAAVSTATRTITFNANGGSVSPTSQNSTQTTTTTYPFNGMYTATSGGSKISTSTATNANTTYYAQWGTSTTTGAWTAVELPIPTWSIHKTTGWYTASSGGTKRENAGGSYTPTTAETLYAQWVSGLHAKVSGTWKPATAAYIKVDGAWKTATAVWIKVAGTWTKL